MNKYIQEGNLYLNKLLEKYPADLADSLRYEANSYLYNYGDHFVNTNQDSLKSLIKPFAEDILFYINKAQSRKRNFDLPGVLCNAYFEIASKIDKEYNTFRPPWSYSLKESVLSDLKLHTVIKQIKQVLRLKSITKLLDDNFIKLILQYKTSFQEYLKKYNIKALVFPNDMSFFENISISTAKETGVLTFIYLHGLPARYNGIDDNRADYLLVWGEAIKENYISSGVKAEKVIVTGHPLYSSIQKTPLKSSIDNVLVLSKSTNGSPHSDKIRMGDRSYSLYFLELLRENLEELGVKGASLRCHPCENPDFYKKQLRSGFYTIDQKSKSAALKNSTLVIGPSSTFIFDALEAGINYLLFEPNLNGKCLAGFDIVPPFDGSHFISLNNSISDFKKNLNPLNNINWEKVKAYSGSRFSFEKFYELLS